MNTTARTTTLCLTAALIIVGVIGTNTAAAATVAPNPASSGQALEIAPPVITLSANPGQVLKTQISLRDVSSTKLIVQGQVNDFTAKGEDGTPKIILDDNETSPYSMKSWFRPLSALTLKPREIQNLPVTINVPANAAPGGYFGVVRFTATAPELKSTGVSLSASLGALVFVRVNGDAKESLKIAEFYTEARNGDKSTLFESLPVNFVSRLKNEGNVHEQPAGQVIVKDMFGKTIATVNVNLPPRNILPGSIRRFDAPLDDAVMGKTKLFGRYTATLKMTYGANKTGITQTLTFWVVPYKLVGFGILGLIVAFFVLKNMLQRYNAAVIKRAQKSSAKRKR